MYRRNLWLVLLIAALTTSSWAGRTKLTDKERAWLDQVDPIITNDERTQFKKRLHTERERARFIELFWAKRDPDLTDSVNPFKREYLARLDYVLAHFEGPRARTPQTARGRIFLLLGKPDKEENRIDYGITGARYRNPFPGKTALLWIYENPGYEYPRDEIRIQFVPTTVFGDYNALSDQFVWHYLRIIKFKFIVHPDLDEAPLLSEATADFQDGTGITGVDVSVPALDADPKKIERRLPQDPLPEGTVTEDKLAGEAPQKIERRLPQEPLPQDALKADDKLAGEAPQKIERRLPQEPLPQDALKADDKLAGEAPQKIERRLPQEPLPDAPKINQVALNVPGVTSEVGSESAAPRPAEGFQTDVGNTMKLAGAMATFKRDSNRSMVLGRLGFPLRSLDFQYHQASSQYAAPMQLNYVLEDQNGQVVLSDRVVREVVLKDKSILARLDPYFTKEFAAILPPGRYQLKMELFDQRAKTRAYAEETIDVGNYQSGEISITPLRLLDPNVNPDEAKFQLDSEAMSLQLNPVFESGDRLYPFLEIVNGPDIDTLGMLAFELLSGDGDVLQSWELFPEEILPSPQRTLYIAPELRLRDTPTGTHTLRFAWQPETGSRIVRELTIVIQ